MLRFKYKGTPFFIVLFILSMWSLHNNVASQSFLTKDSVVDINDGALIMRNDNLGFYLGGQKIGYSRFTLEEESADDNEKKPGKFYKFNSNVFMTIQAMGFPIQISIKQEGEVNEDLSLRSFRFTYEGSGQNLKMEGEIDGNKINLRTISENEHNDSTIDITPPIYHTELAHLLLARDGLSMGKKKEYPIFDPLTGLGKVTLSVLNQESLKLPNGENFSAYVVDINLENYHTKCWINKLGDLYKQTGELAGIKFTAIKETSKQARNFNYISPEIEPSSGEPIQDLIEASMVPSSVHFNQPANVKEMKIRIDGITAKDIIIDNSYQSLVDQGEDSVTLLVKKLDYSPIINSATPEKPPFTNQDSNLKKYLGNDYLIQSTNPRIRNQALEITETANSRWEAAEQIATWLYKNIEKEIRVTIPSAFEVLNSKKGDCNEHSTLFTALARSIGIPTKIEAGLVFQGKGFYYHAWNEVNIDGTWYPIDATLNRIQMDATHIKLAEGSLKSQSEIAPLIGHLKAEVLNFKEDK